MRVHTEGHCNLIAALHTGGRIIKLGRHSPQYGLARARDDAARMWHDIEDGIDPALERETTATNQKAQDYARRKAEQEKLEAEARRLTVAKLAEMYFAAREGESGMKQNRRVIEFSVLPVLASVPVDELRKSQIQRVVDDVRTRGNSTQCYRVFEILRAMLRWVIDQRLSETGSARHLAPCQDPGERRSLRSRSISP